MYGRQIALAVVCLACISSVCVIAFQYLRPASVAKSDPAPLDVPWVESTERQSIAVDDIQSPVRLRAIVNDAKRLPEERVQAIFYLAKSNDWESVETLIGQLNDSSPLVRGRAAAAIRHLLGTDFYFRAQDEPAQRLIAIDGIRRYWQSRKANPPIRNS